MTSTEIINMALRQILEPIVREHLSDQKRLDEIICENDETIYCPWLLN